jgi:hypothetical protein
MIVHPSKTTRVYIAMLLAAFVGMMLLLGSGVLD